MTGPGHATVLTGSYPYQNSISINSWFDVVAKKKAYCVGDSSVKIVGNASKPDDGMSPRNLVGDTVGDELKNAGYPSKVVSIALKDRAAILMAGHRADLAVWFDPKTFQWVSSTYYLPEGKLPAWLDSVNAEVAKLKDKDYRWDIQGPGSGYSTKENDLPDDHWNRRLGTGFPHIVKNGTMNVTPFPVGPELTEAAAEKLFEAYKIGQGPTTDVFAVSFSSHDYLSHAFGPNSREMEEMTIAEDKIISKFLNFLNRKIPGGIKNADIILTADHGAPPNPDWLAKQKVDAGRIDEAALAKDLEAALSKKFGAPSEKWVFHIEDLNVYLNPAALQQRDANRDAVEEEAKAVISKIKGVANVFSRGDYFARRLPPGLSGEQILHTYYPGRSGDLVVIPKPFYMAKGDTVVHMTGYAYDRTVPIILAGRNFKPGRYSQNARVIDIAPTLTFLSGCMPPALSEGRVLTEALSH
jgi:predicted AlkP superfamily pyrophosphatase or phosphodiesterase